jgi:hypothetical protein
VPGGGNRDEFGQALDDAEDNRLDHIEDHERLRRDGWRRWNRDRCLSRKRPPNAMAAKGRSTEGSTPVFGRDKTPLAAMTGWDFRRGLLKLRVADSRRVGTNFLATC